MSENFAKINNIKTVDFEVEEVFKNGSSCFELKDIYDISKNYIVNILTIIENIESIFLTIALKEDLQCSDLLSLNTDLTEIVESNKVLFSVINEKVSCILISKIDFEKILNDKCSEILGVSFFHFILEYKTQYNDIIESLNINNFDDVIAFEDDNLDRLKENYEDTFKDLKTGFVSEIQKYFDFKSTILDEIQKEIDFIKLEDVEDTKDMKDFFILILKTVFKKNKSSQYNYNFRPNFQKYTLKVCIDYFISSMINDLKSLISPTSLIDFFENFEDGKKGIKDFFEFLNLFDLLIEDLDNFKYKILEQMIIDNLYTNGTEGYKLLFDHTYGSKIDINYYHETFVRLRHDDVETDTQTTEILGVNKFRNYTRHESRIYKVRTYDDTKFIETHKITREYPLEAVKGLGFAVDDTDRIDTNLAESNMVNLLLSLNSSLDCVNGLKETFESFIIGEVNTYPIVYGVSETYYNSFDTTDSDEGLIDEEISKHTVKFIPNFFKPKTVRWVKENQNSFHDYILLNHSSLEYKEQKIIPFYNEELLSYSPFKIFNHLKENVDFESLLKEDIELTITEEIVIVLDDFFEDVGDGLSETYNDIMNLFTS